MVRSKVTLDNDIRIIDNPVRDKLSFNFSSTKVQQADIRLYSLAGKILITQKMGCLKGNNLMTIYLSAGLAPGIYVLEINNDLVHQTETFVKQ